MMKKTKEDSPVKEVVRNVLRYDIWLKILTVTSICLIVAGFCVPPTGVVDGSVLIATGILAGFGAMFECGHAVDKGLDAKVTHGDTTINLINEDDGNDKK